LYDYRWFLDRNDYLAAAAVVSADRDQKYKDVIDSENDNDDCGMVSESKSNVKGEYTGDLSSNSDSVFEWSCGDSGFANGKESLLFFLLIFGLEFSLS